MKLTSHVGYPRKTRSYIPFGNLLRVAAPFHARMIVAHGLNACRDPAKDPEKIIVVRVELLLLCISCARCVPQDNANQSIPPLGWPDGEWFGSIDLEGCNTAVHKGISKEPLVKRTSDHVDGTSLERERAVIKGLRHAARVCPLSIRLLLRQVHLMEGQVD